MGTRAKPNSGEDCEGALHKHITGDEHSARGFHYECVLRCLWLLDLRGTENRLAIVEGEDAKVFQPDGSTTYHQAKKREGSHWIYEQSLRKFVERAYSRFSADPSVRHKFYTNQAIPSGNSRLRRGQHLNADHTGVRGSAPTQTESFCKTIRFFPELYQPEPSWMLTCVKERLRDVIDSAYPGCHARNFVNEQEVDDLAAKLLMFEYGLWSRQASVGWKEIDAELGMDRLITDLYSRSMADGTLTPFDSWPSVDNGGPDDERTRAVEAVKDGEVLPRPTLEDEVWALIDEWWAGINQGAGEAMRSDYLVLVLAGSHGTGKTWSLMRIGNQILARYHGVRVCIAAASPPGRPFTLGNLAISQPAPCAVLIDDLFPDWSGLVSSMTGLPPVPLLILGTAVQPNDDEEVRGFTQRLGRRVRVIELHDHLDDTEVDGLARARGVSLSVTEKSRSKATNIRHVAQLLSGISPPENLSGIMGLLANLETRDLLGPILLCTSLRVAVPKGLFERSAGRSLPPGLQPWVLGSRGAAGELLSHEDPDEANRLLIRTLGEARARLMKEWCEQFLRYVDPERLVERAFTRRLFGRFARKDPELCELLLDSCREKLDAVMAREPLWALMFSWLPILAGIRREDLLKLALAKVTTSPTTVAEIAAIIQAYGTPAAREHLSSLLMRLTPWNPILLARFVETVMALPKTERRDTAKKLTGFLVDLPIDAFVETLNQRNCFNESTILASRFGTSDDRRAFLYRLGEMISARLESGGTLKQNWFEASRVLTQRVITQGRFHLAMKTVREMIIGGKMGFKAEEEYKTCFQQEQALVHRELINLGLTLLDTDLRPPDSLPPVTGSLVAFTALWGNEEEWRSVAEAFVALLVPLALREVAFDRLSALVLPTFSGMRRGPRQLCESFLKAISSWIPDERRLVTAETAKLVLKVLGFMAAQPWMNERVQARARKALLELVGHSDAVDETVRASFEALRVTLRMPATDLQVVRMPNEWIKYPPLANTYMTQVGRIRWEVQERIALAKQLIHTWQGMVESRQFLTEALLRLGDLDGATRFAYEMTKNTPTYPDPLGYLSVISVKRGDGSRAENYLTKAARIYDEHERGLHPPLAHWVHREVAGVCEGRRRAMHLLCAELCRDRPLRPYDEVVDEGNE